MTQKKRILALVLTFVMLFACMAMSASAATTEVQPRGTCPSCTYGYMETVYGSYTSSVSDGVYHSCPNVGAGHVHYIRSFPYAYTQCRNCGYTADIPGTLYREYCSYNGYVS